MKAAVTGYITAVINNYTRTIDNLRDNKVEGMAIRRYETIREELSDLLDFVEDIPEENKELEDSCENMSQVERNLRIKISLLEADNHRLNIICKQYMEREVK